MIEAENKIPIKGYATFHPLKHCWIGSGFKAEWFNELFTNKKILCEGAQGALLDIHYGNYPYVTSSTTLPYGACSLGFSPQKINNIYGIAKCYSTRSGIDPYFYQV